MSTSVLDPPQVEELYQRLEEKVRALRPKEDLTALDRSYRELYEYWRAVPDRFPLEAPAAEAAALPGKDAA